MKVNFLGFVFFFNMAWIQASNIKEEEFDAGIIAQNLPENYAHLYFYSTYRLPSLTKLSQRIKCDCSDCKLSFFCPVIKKNKYFPCCEGLQPKHCWQCVRKAMIGDKKSKKLFN